MHSSSPAAGADSPHHGGFMRRDPVVKQLSTQYYANSSASSSDQLSGSGPVSPYERCPLVPSMPDLNRGVGSSGTTAQGHPMSELAGLHAALSSEGVQLLRSPTQLQQHISWQQHQQQQTPPQQQHQQQPSYEAVSPLRSGLQQHRHYAAASKQSPSLAATSAALQPELHNVGAQLHSITAKLQSMDTRSWQLQQQQQQQQALGAIGHTRSSLDKQGAEPQVVVQQLRKSLRHTNELVNERVRRSCSPDKAALLSAHRPAAQPEGAGAIGTGTASSSNSSSIATATALRHSLVQQQQQELLGLAGINKSAAAAAGGGGAPAAAAAAAAAFSQQVAASQSLQRLLKPQPAAAAGQLSPQQVALQGLQQVQDLTEASQMLGWGLATQRVAVAEAQQQMAKVQRVVQMYPSLKDPAEVEKMAERLEAVQRELRAKDAAHINMLNVLRQSTSTPRDKQYAQLQQENHVLQQRLLLAQGQQLQQARHSIGISSQQHLQLQQQESDGSCGELSPVAAEGQRYDVVEQVGGGAAAGGLPPHPRQVNRSLWGALQQQPTTLYQGLAAGIGSSGSSRSGSSGSGSTRSGSTGGSSRSYTPDSSDNGSVSAVIGQPACHQDRHHHHQQQQQRRLAGPGLTPTSSAAAAAADSLQAQAQVQLQQQHAGVRASIELSHKRQLETERRLHETAQQQCALLKAQAAQLERQLQGANAQIKELQQQQRDKDRRCSSSLGSSAAAAAVAAADEQQQQREQLLTELQEQLAQAQQDKAGLQKQVQELQVLEEKHKELRRQQCSLLLQAERIVEMDKQRTQEFEQLQQQVQDLQQQLAAAQEGRAAAEGCVQECKRQLSAADAEKAVLMDRIRQLADRASLADCSHHSQRSSNSGGSGGGSSDLVAGLRAQLDEAQRQEERLQVANAQLQERLSRLQADEAARDASSGGGSNNSITTQQQHQPASWQHDKQQLQQQVAALQEQLAAAQAAAAAGGNAQQQQQQPSEQEQPPSEQQQGDVEALQEQVQQLQAELEDRTQELDEWQIHADALEKDLEDLKAQVLAADGLQQQLGASQAQLAAARSQQQQLQQEVEQARSRASQLEYELHDVVRERNGLRAHADALSVELANAREGSADLRLRLEHFTGPAGPQARVRQLEGALQQAQRRVTAADAKAAAAEERVAQLNTKLGVAEDRLIALEGHTSVIEEELARYSQLPDL